MTEEYETIQVQRGHREENINTQPSWESVRRKHGVFYSRPPPPLRSNREEVNIVQQEPPTRGRHHRYRSFTAEEAGREIRGKSESERHRYQVEKHKEEHPHGQSYKSVSRRYRRPFKDRTK